MNEATDCGSASTELQVDGERCRVRNELGAGRTYGSRPESLIISKNVVTESITV